MICLATCPLTTLTMVRSEPFFTFSLEILEKPKTGLGSDGDSPPRRGDVSPRGSDDEQKQEETRIEVQIPKINTNLGDNIHFVRYVLQSNHKIATCLTVIVVCYKCISSFRIVEIICNFVTSPDLTLFLAFRTFSPWSRGPSMSSTMRMRLRKKMSSMRKAELGSSSKLKIPSDGEKWLTKPPVGRQSNQTHALSNGRTVPSH